MNRLLFTKPLPNNYYVLLEEDINFYSIIVRYPDGKKSIKEVLSQTWWTRGKAVQKALEYSNALETLITEKLT